MVDVLHLACSVGSRPLARSCRANCWRTWTDSMVSSLAWHSLSHLLSSFRAPSSLQHTLDTLIHTSRLIRPPIFALVLQRASEGLSCARKQLTGQSRPEGHCRRPHPGPRRPSAWRSASQRQRPSAQVCRNRGPALWAQCASAPRLLPSAARLHASPDEPRLCVRSNLEVRA